MVGLGASVLGGAETRGHQFEMSPDEDLRWSKKGLGTFEVRTGEREALGPRFQVGS